MLSGLRRWLPAVVVLALLASAVLPTERSARARDNPSPLALNPYCSVVLQEGDSADTFTPAGSEGIIQPLASTANISSVSFGASRTGYTYFYGTISALAWNANDLVPDPTTVTLRTRFFFVSTYGVTNSVTAYFDPPVVRREYPGIADPMRSAVAIRYEYTEGSTPAQLEFNPNGDAVLPIAMRAPVGALPTPLAGSHPVLAMTVCGGDEGLQALQVMQGVSTTDADEYTTARNYLQRFRVPSTTQVSWVEFPLVGAGGWPAGPPPKFVLLDLASTSVDPPGTPGDTLAQALLNRAFSGTEWTTHVDFDHTITLEPNHDYGLYLDSQGSFIPLMRRRTGHEGTPFTSTIGPLHERDSTSAPWREREARTLSFRLIGVPVQALDAPVAALNVVQLRATPNPSHGPVMLALTGARGAVGYEVLDARGRRVAGATSADGRWLWRGVDDAGRPLAAGVYFVRARSASGGTATERVVRVR